MVGSAAGLRWARGRTGGCLNCDLGDWGMGCDCRGASSGLLYHTETGGGARGGSGGLEGGWVVWGEGMGAEGYEVDGCLNCDLGGFEGWAGLRMCRLRAGWEEDQVGGLRADSPIRGNVRNIENLRIRRSARCQGPVLVYNCLSSRSVSSVTGMGYSDDARHGRRGWQGDIRRCALG